MISKLILSLLLIGSTSHAGFTVPVRGKVTHIEKGQAVVVSANGEKMRIPMKDLSEAKKKKIFDASGSKKEVVIYLAPQVFKK